MLAQLFAAQIAAKEVIPAYSRWETSEEEARRREAEKAWSLARQAYVDAKSAAHGGHPVCWYCLDWWYPDEGGFDCSQCGGS